MVAIDFGSAGVTAVIDTTVAPSITVGGASTGGGGVGDLLLSAIKPRVTIYAGGSQLCQVAPYGDPSQGFPLGIPLALGVAAVVALAVFGAIKLVR